MLTYNVFELYKVQEGNTSNLGTAFNVLANAGTPLEFVIGQKMRILAQIQSSTPINIGDRFCFNLGAFTPSQGVLAPPSGTGLSGWVLECVDNTGANFVFGITFQTRVSSEITQINASIVAGGTVATNTISIQFDFFLTQDIANWISDIVVPSERRFPFALSTGLAVQTENAAGSAYFQQKILEAVFFELGIGNVPIRFATHPSFGNTIFIKTEGKFYDRGVNNAQAWIGANLAFPAAKRWFVDLPTFTPVELGVDLLLWLKAEDISAITGGFWQDRSSYSRTVTLGETTPGFLPTPTGTPLNGFVTANVPSQGFLNFTPTIPSSVTKFSGFFVVESTGGNEVFASFSNGAVLGRGVVWEYFPGTRIVRQRTRSASEAFFNTTTNPAATPTGFNIVYFSFEVLNPTTIRHTVGYNGQTPTIVDYVGDTNVPFSVNNTLFSVLGGSYLAAWGGRVAEVILTKDGTNTEVDKLFGYAAWKFNLVSLLPPSHPYKNNPSLFANLTTLDFKRKNPPFLSNIGDLNFNILDDKIFLGIQSKFNLDINLGSPSFTPNTLELRLFEDVSPTSGVLPFQQDIAISGATIPTTAPSPANTRLDGTLGGILGTNNTVWIAIGGSTVWSIVSNELRVRNLLIDGALLQPNKQYRVLAILTDSTANSGHGRTFSMISPIINPVTPAPTIGDIEQIVANYNQSASTNSPTLAPLERVRYRLRINTASYQNSFNPLTTDLRRVRFTLNYAPVGFVFPAVPQIAEYDFVLGQSTGQVPMSFSQVGNNLFFDVTLRTINQFPGAPSNRLGTTRWDIECEFPTGSGTDTLTVQVDGTLQVRPKEGLTPAGVVASIEFLDYAAFVASQEVIRTSYCRSEDFAVVKMTLNPFVAPVTGANPLAIFHQGFGTSYPSVEEEESYASPQGLPQLNSPLLQGVDVIFNPVTRIAYFIVNLQQIPATSNTSLYQVGGIVQLNT